MAFTGFPPEALTFLAGMREHNDAAWFAENRAMYEGALLEPAREFVVDLGLAFDAAGIEVNAVPKVNGSLMRITRRYKRVPAPYSADHERADLLKHDGLFAWVSAPPPPELFTERLVEHCLARLAPVAPLVAWIAAL